MGGQDFEVLGRKLHFGLPQCALFRVRIQPKVDFCRYAGLACTDFLVAPHPQGYTRSSDVPQLSREFMSVGSSNGNSILFHERAEALPQIDYVRFMANRKV